MAQITDRASVTLPLFIKGRAGKGFKAINKKTTKNRPISETVPISLFRIFPVA
jgi:hypothetical protein